MRHKLFGLKALSLSCLLFLFCGGSSLTAGVLYSQPWDPSGTVYASQNDTTPGGYGNFATMYDDFTLASAATITEVDWTGGYYDPATQGPISQFTVTFYADNAGQPGAVAESFIIPGTAGETYVSSTSDILIYSYSVAVSFAAAAGTQYWLSVEPDLAFPPQWGWFAGTGGDGLSYQDFLGSRNQYATDMAFALSGQPNGGGVPEPVTFSLVGLGLAALAAWRLRR